jgi:hypothetical protein
MMPIPKQKTPKEHKLDEAVKETFPASDPPSTGSSTSTEAPTKPVERQAPQIRKEDIEAAQRGDGHKQ